MKKRLFLILFVFSLLGFDNKTENIEQSIVTSDIDNFWEAYDQIITTKDTLQQIQYLQDLFISKASDGQKKMIEVRNYTPQEYIHVINSYPKFWTSVRSETYKSKTLSKELAVGLKKLKLLYPELKPAKIYFTIGALKSNGTTLNNSVLIGSELAFANKDTPTDEFPEQLSHLKSYFKSSPSKGILFLNIHEYIHTQQNTTIGDNLLAQTVLEGVAEFVAEKVLNTASPNPQIDFGKKNDQRIKVKFELEMFSPNTQNWIWNSPNNEFNMRDLAYYVGYSICENYYDLSNDKEKAIIEMIQLDYNNEDELIEFVEKSGYFNKKLIPLKESFEKKRPTVVGLGEILNQSTVELERNVLTINFSEPMDERYRNFQFGPLGEENVIRLKEFLGFSPDGKSVSFEIEKLEPAKEYQIVVGSGFRNIDGIPLIPFLIELNTAKQ